MPPGCSPARADALLPRAAHQPGDQRDVRDPADRFGCLRADGLNRSAGTWRLPEMIADADMTVRPQAPPLLRFVALAVGSAAILFWLVVARASVADALPLAKGVRLGLYTTLTLLLLVWPGLILAICNFAIRIALRARRARGGDLRRHPSRLPAAALRRGPAPARRTARRHARRATALRLSAAARFVASQPIPPRRKIRVRLRRNQTGGNHDHAPSYPDARRIRSRARMLGRTARAQAWPNRPVRLIVPFPAGGGADTIARIVGASSPRSGASR